MAIWLKSKTKTTAETVFPPLRGVRLETVRDVRGFALGVLLSASRSYATVGLRVHNAHTFTVGTWRMWEHAVSHDETVVATCASMWGAHAVMWVTFEAESKEEFKDHNEFLTRIARVVPVTYDVADDLGFEATPLSVVDIEQFVAEVLGNTEKQSFPPMIRQLSESLDSVVIGDTVTVSFEVVDFAEQPHFLDDVLLLVRKMENVAGGLIGFQFGVCSRSAVNREDFPRVVAVLSITAKTIEAVDEASQVLLMDLSAVQRLRVRRLWGRQAMGVLASLGVGVLGWQQLEVAV